MADTKHTPGPWAVYGTLHPGEFIIHQGGHGLAVTRRANGSGNANARLIAAAPELLEALRKLVAYVDENVASRDVDPHMDRAEAAIAKATGGEP